MTLLRRIKDKIRSKARLAGPSPGGRATEKRAKRPQSRKGSPIPKSPGISHDQGVSQAVDDPHPSRPPDGDDDSDKGNKIKTSFSHLRDITAEDIMTPRAEIRAVSAEVDTASLLTTFHQTGHSRLPVYSTTLDTIYGLVYIKDLLPYVLSKEEFSLSKCIRRVMFVSPAITLDNLLLDMQHSLTQMVLIVDEHGGVDGLLTMEDILEELVGEIRDEHEGNRDPLIVSTGPSAFLAQGRAPLTLVTQVINHSLPALEDDDIETLGGYILALKGVLPTDGSTIVEPTTGIKFTIVKASPRTIDRVMIELPCHTKSEN